MVEGTVKVLNPIGLHARPAALLVQVANKYTSSITLLKDGEIANAKSIMSIMSLKISQYQDVDINIEGQDEKEALREVIKLLSNDFEENL